MKNQVFFIIQSIGDVSLRNKLLDDYNQKMKSDEPTEIDKLKKELAELKRQVEELKKK